MKIKDGFILRKVGEQYVAVATGKASEHFSGMLRMKDSSAFVFRLLQEGISEDSLVSRLTAEYDVSEETARQDIARFTASLYEVGALE